MNLDQITLFLGWCAVLNIAFLSMTTLLIVVLKGQILAFHSKLFNVAESKLNEIYFSYLGHYKVVTLAFFVVPYLALKIMA